MAFEKCFRPSKAKLIQAAREDVVPQSLFAFILASNANTVPSTLRSVSSIKLAEDCTVGRSTEPPFGAQNAYL